jgi:hypothetical protein
MLLNRHLVTGNLHVRIRAPGQTMRGRGGMTAFPCTHGHLQKITEVHQPMSRSRTISFLVVFGLAVAACSAGSTPAPATPAAPSAAASGAAMMSANITLDTLNASGVSGSAKIEEKEGGKVKVTIEVTPNGNLKMPAHIHIGQCGATLGDVKYPLSDVDNGKSETTVDVNFADLETGGFAVNLHKSADDLKTYTACGNIPKA